MILLSLYNWDLNTNATHFLMSVIKNNSCFNSFILKDTPEHILIPLLYLVITLYRHLLFPWRIAPNALDIKNPFFSNHLLSHTILYNPSKPNPVQSNLFQSNLSTFNSNISNWIITQSIIFNKFLPIQLITIPTNHFQ